MRADRLASLPRRAVAFDTETHRIQPGLLAPPLVCCSVAWTDEVGQTRVELRAGARETVIRLIALLQDRGVVLVLANAPFDFAVCAVAAARELGVDILPLIFRAYDEDRVFDVQTAFVLDAIAHGYLGLDPRTGPPDTAKKLQDPVTRKRARSSLSVVVDVILGRADAKANDAYRESFALFEGLAIEEYPETARKYMGDDARNTLESCLALAGHVPRPSPHVWDRAGRCTHCGAEPGLDEPPPCPPRLRPADNLHDLAHQCRAHFAMHLGACWGFAVDVDATLRLEQELLEKKQRETGRFVELKYLRWKTEKGETKACAHQAYIKRRVAEAYGCVDPCATCAGTGSVPSAKTGAPVGCRRCDSTGLDLDAAPVPRTKGSKCRTCRGARWFTRPKKKPTKANPDPPEPQPEDCAQCAGQDDVIPGCQISRDACSESGDEDLIDYAAFSEDNKLLKVYIPFLRRGISEVPDEEDEGEENEE